MNRIDKLMAFANGFVLVMAIIGFISTLTTSPVEAVKEVPVEIIKEVPKEVIKEVVVREEVPIEVEVVKYIHDESYDMIEISPEEYELLAQIVSLEATNQGDIGQRAVIEVCLNRVLNNWGSSLWDVLTQKGQFATYPIVGTDSAWAHAGEQEYSNIDYVLVHGATILPTDYVYFDTKGVNGHDHIRINDHYFGKE